MAFHIASKKSISKINRLSPSQKAKIFSKINRLKGHHYIDDIIQGSSVVATPIGALGGATAGFVGGTLLVPPAGGSVGGVGGVIAGTYLSEKYKSATQRLLSKLHKDRLKKIKQLKSQLKQKKNIK